MLKMWKEIDSTIALAMRRVVAVSLGRLYDIRERIIVIAAIGVGVGLAFGLYSPLQDLTIAIAGVSVYLAIILIDPLKGLALWLVTHPLLDKYLNISLGNRIPDLSLTRLCIALITVLLIGRAAIRLQRLKPINKFDILAFAFMVGMAQSGFRGNRGVSTFQIVFDLYFVPVLVYFTVKNLVSNRRSVHLILYAMLSIALYSAVYAFYETTTGNVLFYDSNYAAFYESGLRILRGIWGSNTGFGRVFVMAIPILFYFYLKTPSFSRKLLWAICLVLVFGGLYLTYKRAAWIAAVAVTFFMQFFYPQFRRLFIVLLVIVTVAIAINKDSITSSVVYTDRVNSESSKVEDRADGWKNGIEIWSTSPLLGVGYRQFQKHAIEAGYRDRDLESAHLDILVSAGLVGFLPYIGLLLLMIYDGYRHYRGLVPGSLADPDLVAVFWGVLVGYVITAATSQINHLVINAMLFAMAGVVIYARREVVSTQPEVRQRGVDIVPSTLSR
jgi:O-antigen ligase